MYSSLSRLRKAEEIIKRRGGKYAALEAPWTALGRHYLRNRAEEWGLGMDILLCQFPRETRRCCPPFWLEALEKWQELDWGIDLDHLPAIEKWNFPLWKNKWTKFKSTQKITEELCGAGLIRGKNLFLDGSLGHK